MIDPVEIQLDDPAAGEIAHAADDLNALPQPGLVVGIGASAGGLQALEQFFTHIPTASGMAFVVIVYRSPQPASHLATLLQRSMPMPVTQVTESVHVAPDHVYVIPPAKHLTIANDQIQLREPERARDRRFPIDRFFRTLAETHGPRAAGIILSGTGASGTLGLMWIKEYGGVTLVQDPLDAAYDGMPRSAIETGLVDIVAPAAQLPDKLIAYWQSAGTLQLPAPAEPPHDGSADALADILALLHARTGHDVASYTRTHLQRCIARRMQLGGVVSLPSYLALLRVRPGEAQALMRDLLISVTHFFRDPAAFATLAATVVPKLFVGKQAGDPVRAWVAGCATGEEAYSVAILLGEYADQLDAPPRIQVFATDLDAQPIAVARSGRYPQTIAADVPAERLRRFFFREHERYQVNTRLRDTLVFATHNLLRDPPFSKLDLIACRNVLISLNRSAQQRILERFHFALRPDGYLFLGMSEFADGPLGLFASLDQQHRIFVPLAVAHPAPLPGTVPVITAASGSAAETAIPGVWPRFLVRSLHQQLLEAYGLPSVLVNATYEIVCLSESASPLLRFAGGAPSHNLLDVVLPGLRHGLRIALEQAAQTGMPAAARAAPVEIAGSVRAVNVLVRPIHDPKLAQDYTLVLFDDSGAAGESVPQHDAASATEPLVRQLADELRHVNDQFQATVERYETATEELESANVELRAINAELAASRATAQAGVAERTRTEHEIVARAHQQAAIAELGLRALSAQTDLDALLGDAVALVARTLDVEYCKVLEVLADGKALRLRSGVGWKDGTVGHAMVSAGTESQAGYTLMAGKPVIVEDLRSETRFHVSSLLLDHAVVSGMSVIIYNRHVPFGVLGAHTTRRRAFTVDDQHFLQAIANVLAAAIGRQRLEAARQQLLLRFDTAQEDERRRIARELHDQLGQYLTALMLGLTTLRDSGQIAVKAVAQLQRLQGIVDQVSQEVHHLALELRPTALDDLGLQATLANYIADWSEHAQVPVELHSQGLERVRLPPQLETTIYRMVQEALTNVLQHAAARHVGLILERRSDQVVVVVEDNGRGFDADAVLNGPDVERRLGLLGMEERAALAGGTLTIESVPGHGTTVILRIPLPLGGEGADRPKLRVVLADDHAMVREGLKTLINAQPDMEVIAEASDGRSALQQVQDGQPDVVLMDVAMPEVSGAQATEQLRHACPAVKVLALSVHEDTSYVGQLLEAGAAGYVLKRSAADTLIAAIRMVAAGQLYLDPALTRKVLRDLLDMHVRAPSAGAGDLSDREAEVIRLLAQGYSNKEIAAQLAVSAKTVETYKARAMEKLGLDSRVALVRYAVQHGWLHDG